MTMMMMSMNTNSYHFRAVKVNFENIYAHIAKSIIHGHFSLMQASTYRTYYAHRPLLWLRTSNV